MKAKKMQSRAQAPHDIAKGFGCVGLSGVAMILGYFFADPGDRFYVFWVAMVMGGFLILSGTEVAKEWWYAKLGMSKVAVEPMVETTYELVDFYEYQSASNVWSLSGVGALNFSSFDSSHQNKRSNWRLRSARLIVGQSVQFLTVSLPGVLASNLAPEREPILP
jgi:hypothetical protein